MDILKPVFRQRVGRHQPAVDFPGNDVRLPGCKLRLDKDDPDVMQSGEIDELFDFPGLGGFAFDFNGNLRKAVGIGKITPGRVENQKLFLHAGICEQGGCDAVGRNR